MKKVVAFVLVLTVLLPLLIGTSHITLAADGDGAKMNLSEETLKTVHKERELAASPGRNPYNSLKQEAGLEATVTTPDGFEFNTSSHTITDYSGSGGNITIPSSINGVPVEIIGERAFSGSRSITSINIPSSVIRIDNQAFLWCDGLTSVEIPSSVKWIGDGPFASCDSLTSIEVSSGNPYFKSVNGVLYNKAHTEIIQYPQNKSGSFYSILSGVIKIRGGAFEYCDKLTSISIPNGVTVIGRLAFRHSSVGSISLPATVETIEYSAFEFCESLSSVSIPASVSSIGNHAFFNCPSLSSITVDGANAHYCSVDDVLFNKDMTNIIRYPSAKSDTSYAIPMGIEVIGVSAFDHCLNLTSVEIPSGVTTIRGVAFWYCSAITEITIPSGVTDIYSGAFSFCESLTRADIPASVSYIGDTAFTNCHEDLAFYGMLGSYAQGYAAANGIPFYINITRSEDTIGDGILLRTFFNESDEIVCKEYYRGAADTYARIQSDYFNMAGTMVFTEIYDASDTIIASVWFQDDGATKQFKNYYADGLLYFQEEYDQTDTLIASIWFQEDGNTRLIKNYYSSGVLRFQEEYNYTGSVIASIWYQADGVTRHFKNYYNWPMYYLYFQEEYNESGTMIASIDFRSDGTRERKCYYRTSDGSLYLIEYYDENEDCFHSEWF